MRRTRQLAAVAALAMASTGPGLTAPATAAGSPAPIEVNAAAYVKATGASGTSLPSEVTTPDGPSAVTWDLATDEFDTLYDTVTVSGTAADGTPVTGTVEVIPRQENPLLYFVDAGHGGDSQSRPWSTWRVASRAHTGVTTLAPTLLNSEPDQPYSDGGTWGYTYDGDHNVKVTVDGGDPAGSVTEESLAALPKADLGLRTNSPSISYRVDLEPGLYTLTTGYKEFYAGPQSRTRGIMPTLGYTLDGDAVSEPMPGTTLSTASGQKAREVVASTLLTVPEGASDVTLSWVRSSGEAPMISWFAVAGGEVLEADPAHTTDDPPAPDDAVTDITVDAADIAATNVNGLTFKGFGVLTGNSSSALLMDYKAQHPEAYTQLLEVLFGGPRPVMNHVKIEMGNDRNNSTGPNPATMRTENEPANVAREPGFQLAADALALNPRLQVSILRWNAPAWANTNDKVYAWYKATILAAYRTYGYMVDYVNPGINEHAADLGWTKEFADRVRTDSQGFESPEEQALFNSIKVVISDEVGTGTFGGAMLADASLAEAVAVAAFHYNTNDDAAGSFTRLAEQLDKEVWNSEGQATFSDSSHRPSNNTADPTTPGTGLGGTGSSLEMANTFVKGFVNSRRSHVIYQPAIGSFYEGGQYSFKEIVSARDPWSGWIHYDAGVAVLQHFSSFATTGWENEDNTAGIWRLVPQASASTATGTNPVNGRNGEPNYLTMAAPDGSGFSTVLVNDSERTRTYRISPKGFGTDDASRLAVWTTRAADEGEAFNAHYKEHVGDVAGVDGVYTVIVEPYSITTVSTLTPAQMGNEWTTPLPTDGERTVLGAEATDEVLWADDFNYTGMGVPVYADGGVSGTEDLVASRGGETGATPLYTWDRNGAFEAYRTADDQWVLRQQVDAETTGVGGAWNGGDPLTG
ncbi:hypothetical protein, partial [Actinomyces sp. MRS3W]|uniref:hypothetical protein n=1 Tax=Actinomyces sp. MRS3W TaxID=2800796 RepID=UPI0028FD93C6